jgi:hypothetical protein
VEVGGLDVGWRKGVECGVAGDSVVDVVADAEGEVPVNKRMGAGEVGDGVLDAGEDAGVAVVGGGGEEVGDDAAASEEGFGQVEELLGATGQACDEVFLGVAAGLDFGGVARGVVGESPPCGLAEDVDDEDGVVAEHAAAAGEGGVVEVGGEADRVGGVAGELHRRFSGNGLVPEEEEAFVVGLDEVGFRDGGFGRDVREGALAVTEGERFGEGLRERMGGAVDALEAAVGDRVVGEEEGVMFRALEGTDVAAEEVLRAVEHRGSIVHGPWFIVHCRGARGAAMDN